MPTIYTAYTKFYKYEMQKEPSVFMELELLGDRELFLQLSKLIYKSKVKVSDKK